MGEECTSSTLVPGNFLAMIARGSVCLPASGCLAASVLTGSAARTDAQSMTEKIPVNAREKSLFMTAFRLGAERPPASFDAGGDQRFRSLAEAAATNRSRKAWLSLRFHGEKSPRRFSRRTLQPRGWC